MDNREILISIDEQEKRVAIVKNGRLDEFFLERVGHRHLAGNIYKGKVAQIVKGMEAAFIDIGLDKNGFLYIDEASPSILEQEEYALEPDNGIKILKDSGSAKTLRIDHLLHRGQEVLVQVVKDPFGTKGCRLSSQISLPGRFMVLMPNSRTIGISKRITDERERSRLKSLLAEIGVPKDVGCIFRTQAAGKGEKEFLRELKYLLRLWRVIKSKASKKNAPCLIHEEYDLILRTARDIFGNDIAHITVDSRDEYRKIMNFVRILVPALRSRIKLYREPSSLFEKFAIEKQIDGLFSRQIFLKKGGYIIIEPTEALISIDVNSGGFVDSNRLEETAFLTNAEAAKEIARQIKLRDLAGIIVIDFIDMENSAHKRKVLEILEHALAEDKAKVNIYPFSALGLVQIARQRIRRNIESISYQDCPVCKGRGGIKSTQTIAIKIVRKIRNFVLMHKKRYVEINVHPLIAMRFLNEDRTAINALERRLHVKISILTDEHLNIEEVKFL